MLREDVGIKKDTKSLTPAHRGNRGLYDDRRDTRQRVLEQAHSREPTLSVRPAHNKAEPRSVE